MTHIRYQRLLCSRRGHTQLIKNKQGVSHDYALAEADPLRPAPRPQLPLPKLWQRETGKRQRLMETHQDGCGYLERTMHIWAFVSEINQPADGQSDKEPPGKTEEIQKAVEVPREEHYHRQRVLGEGTRNHAWWVRNRPPAAIPPPRHCDPSERCDGSPTPPPSWLYSALQIPSQTMTEGEGHRHYPHVQRRSMWVFGF